MAIRDPAQYAIEPLGAGRLQEAFTLTCRVFAEDSVLHRALGVSVDAYRAHLRGPFEAMAAEALSLVAVDAQGQVVGCLVARDLAGRGLGADPVPAALASVDALLEVLARPYLSSRAVTSGRYLLVDMAVVSRSVRGRGLYRALREAAHRAGRAAGFEWVVGELSSRSTQRLCIEELGHRVCAEVGYADFEFEGARPFAAIVEPPSIVLAEGSIG